MKSDVFVPSALKLYEHGFARLFNSDWVKVCMMAYMGVHLSGKKPPSDLLHSTLPNGILYHLGLWLFNDYFVSNPNFPFMYYQEKTLFLQNLVHLLGKAGCE